MRKPPGPDYFWRHLAVAPAYLIAFEAVSIFLEGMLGEGHLSLSAIVGLAFGAAAALVTRFRYVFTAFVGLVCAAIALFLLWQGKEVLSAGMIGGLFFIFGACLVLFPKVIMINLVKERVARLKQTHKNLR